jgi:hypothetical protein
MIKDFRAMTDAALERAVYVDLLTESNYRAAVAEMERREALKTEN